jgi:hypothetical protein
MGVMTPSLIWSIAYLTGFTALFFPLALHTMRRRLIQ